MYKDHKLLTDAQELSLALNVAESVLVEFDTIHIRDIPKLLPDEEEDNDSEDEEDTDERDFDEDMKSLKSKIKACKRQHSMKNVPEKP